MAYKGNRWQALKPGDTVDVIAPGFACTAEALKSAEHFLAEWGLEARVSRKIFGRDVLSSNNDEERFAQLSTALSAPDSRAVWCLRGGYGSLRLVPQLVKMKRPNVKPKLFIGLSDITSIYLHLNQAWGWPAVHGPLLDRLGKGMARPKFERELKKIVFGETRQIEFSRLKPLNEHAARHAKIHAPVSGGNLITLQSSIGTRAEWHTKGKILFFEDIGERGYRVDRVLEQFKQAGFFKSARAIVFGEFTGGHEQNGKSLVPAVLRRFAQTVNVPVLTGLQTGHGVIQRPLPLGPPALLELGSTARLICDTGSLN